MPRSAAVEAEALMTVTESAAVVVSPEILAVGQHPQSASIGG